MEFTYAVSYHLGQTPRSSAFPLPFITRYNHVRESPYTKSPPSESQTKTMTVGMINPCSLHSVMPHGQ